MPKCACHDANPFISQRARCPFSCYTPLPFPITRIALSGSDSHEISISIVVICPLTFPPVVPRRRGYYGNEDQGQVNSEVTDGDFAPDLGNFFIEASVEGGELSIDDTVDDEEKSDDGDIDNDETSNDGTIYKDKDSNHSAINDDENSNDGAVDSKNFLTTATVTITKSLPTGRSMTASGRAPQVKGRSWCRIFNHVR